MKTFAISTAVLFGIITGPALAADLPRKAPTMMAPTAVGPDFSGLYAGISGGYGWGTGTHTAGIGEDDATVGPNAILRPGSSSGGVPGEAFTHDVRGGTFGGHIGWNRQISNWLFGLEASASWTNIKGNTGSVLVLYPPTNVTNFNTFSTGLNWLATATPRAGWVFN